MVSVNFLSVCTQVAQLNMFAFSKFSCVYLPFCPWSQHQQVYRRDGASDLAVLKELYSLKMHVNQPSSPKELRTWPEHSSSSNAVIVVIKSCSQWKSRARMHKHTKWERRWEIVISKILDFFNKPTTVQFVFRLVWVSQQTAQCITH